MVGGNGIGEYAGKSGRELAVEALHNIETHEKVCEVRSMAVQKDVAHIKSSQDRLEKSYNLYAIERKQEMKDLYGRWWMAARATIVLLAGLAIWLIKEVLSK
ncbi:hypothetical protein MNBD_GAMMA15-2241 [hydrothermal vent metagenome]|uniref:Uncharacterized protein n=1 Tax=hydrothermal vent metagenome TaxID=652676 RepID=A0A3B0YE18_9ZZZZ